MASRATDARAAAEARAAEVRQLKAESKAVRIAAEHRENFITAARAQLLAEERDVEAASKEVEGRASCVAMVGEELAAAEQRSRALVVEAEAAERARDDKSRAVDALRSSGRARLDALRSQLGSEAAVLTEQQKYADSLAARLRDASLQCIDGTAAEAAMSTSGNALVQANAEAARTLVAQLAERLQKCTASLNEASRNREVQERLDVAEAARLAEQKATMGEALQKLAEYQEGLTAKLASLPRDAVEFGAPTPRTALAAVPAPPPAISTEQPRGELVSLKSLHHSAAEASEASRVIDRLSSSAAASSRLSNRRSFSAAAAAGA